MTAYLVVWEWRDLLDSRDGNIVDALVLALLEKRVVDLTGTQDMSPDLLRLDQVLGVGIRNIALEVGFADHLGEVRASLRVTEERF